MNELRGAQTRRDVLICIRLCIICVYDATGGIGSMCFRMPTAVHLVVWVLVCGCHHKRVPNGQRNTHIAHTHLHTPGVRVRVCVCLYLFVCGCVRVGHTLITFVCGVFPH